MTLADSILDVAVGLALLVLWIDVLRLRRTVRRECEARDTVAVLRARQADATMGAVRRLGDALAQRVETSEARLAAGNLAAVRQAELLAELAEGLRQLAERVEALEARWQARRN